MLAVVARVCLVAALLCEIADAKCDGNSYSAMDNQESICRSTLAGTIHRDNMGGYSGAQCDCPQTCKDGNCFDSEGRECGWNKGKCKPKTGTPPPPKQLRTGQLRPTNSEDKGPEDKGPENTRATTPEGPQKCADAAPDHSDWACSDKAIFDDEGECASTCGEPDFGDETTACCKTPSARKERAPRDRQVRHIVPGVLKPTASGLTRVVVKPSDCQAPLNEWRQNAGKNAGDAPNAAERAAIKTACCKIGHCKWIADKSGLVGAPEKGWEQASSAVMQFEAGTAGRCFFGNSGKDYCPAVAEPSKPAAETNCQAPKNAWLEGKTTGATPSATERAEIKTACCEIADCGWYESNDGLQGAETTSSSGAIRKFEAGTAGNCFASRKSGATTGKNYCSA